MLGWEALAREAHTEAQALFQQGADTCQSVGHQDMLSWALAFLGYADREMGQVTKARGHLCQAAQIMPKKQLKDEIDHMVDERLASSRLERSSSISVEFAPHKFACLFRL